MRGTAFRGRTKLPDGSSKWYFGDCRTRYFDKIFVFIEDDKTLASVDPKTVGQWSGVCDKNEQEIFDGDIVRQNGANGAVRFGIIEFDSGAFSVRWNDKRYGLDFVGYVPDLEIVGNIYDNPELVDINL